MRTYIIIIAVIFQIAILAFMAGQREYILHEGKIIYLRTAPVDPRDPFRGDYVHLSYEISSVSPEYFRDGLKTRQAKNGDRVFAVLDVDENQNAKLRYLTDNRPCNELFITGRVDNSWRSSSSIRVRYGIEAFFLQQGKGLELERGTSWQMDPFDVKIALGSNGIAVLKNYRTKQTQHRQ